MLAVAMSVTVGAACVPEPGPPPETTTTTTTATTTTTTTAPPVIAITGSYPSSPGAPTTPRLVGIAPLDATTVRIFAGAGCSGTIWAGSLATFTGAGIAVDVAMGATAVFSAVASGPGLLTPCSAPFTYVNTLVPPNAFESEPNDTLAEADPITVAVGSPAEIAATLDGPTGASASDLFTFSVEPGRSIRIETFDWSAATCVLTDTHIYLAPLDGGVGGNDDDGGIDLCSLLAPGIGPYGANLLSVAGGDYLLNVKGSPLGGSYRIRLEVFE